MAIVVQKYGGSSLNGVTRIKQVATRITESSHQGYQVVVVVSAIGNSTNDLIALANKLTSNPADHELDVLMPTGELISATLTTMALNDLGCKAISLTGPQAGIQTDNQYRKARIVNIETTRIREELAKGNVLIVAGFQGVSSEMDITTLGRGGSDTTAVALAVALKAQECQIFTDVEGIYTADPRIVPEATKLSEIGYEEMLELSNYGFKIHPRSIELGAIYKMPIRVRSSSSSAVGTLIHQTHLKGSNDVCGIAADQDVASITLRSLPNKPGTASRIFGSLARADISVDTIVKNISFENQSDLTFTVSRADLQKSLAIVKPIASNTDNIKISSDATLAKVSIVGTGMQKAPGFAAKVFMTLSSNHVDIFLIATSEIRITCVVPENQVPAAVLSLHRVFELNKAT
jgi:aspartate kinase